MSRTKRINLPLMSLQLLIEGNKRFVKNNLSYKDNVVIKRSLLTGGQHPFALVLTCSDSRVVPEIVFDQSLGSLFVMRIVGNILDTVVEAGIEYAIQYLRVPLIVIMGHENCGAIRAAVEGFNSEGSLSYVIDKIRPSVEKAKMGTGDLYNKTMEEFTGMCVSKLRGTPLISDLIKNGELIVIGAKYSLESGLVEFFE